MGNSDQQLRNLLEAAIKKEVKRQVQELVPQVVKETMSHMFGVLINEGVAASSVGTNSHKRVGLQNNAKRNTKVVLEESLQSLINEDIDDFDFGEIELDIPTPPKKKMTVEDRIRMAEKMGYGPESAATSNGLIVPPAITEHGTPIPVNADEMNPVLLENFNKDYRDPSSVGGTIMASILKKGK